VQLCVDAGARLNCIHCNTPSIEGRPYCTQCGAPLPAAAPHAARAGAAGGSEAFFVLAGMAGLTLVGLIASVAVPAVQDRGVRAQVAEALALSTDARQAISEALAAGEDPAQIDQDSLQLGEPASSPNVEFVRVAAGSVVIRFSSKARRPIAGQFIVIAPARNDVNQIDWLCGRHIAPEGWEALVPSAARHTTVADRYLPATCRR
jgi:type IV pilus assembly protein PilA